ncbi:9301_t:CDS:2 [Cetraspora pellucida]|uniref:9301_t:CDS:1 n=1 Tax=Cetraspora pellucida TaxID=1433469 RepID=A0ACA9KKF0_9GLOM|nr:9301_t:CDS:2 [Cetraspora pellucida]
MFSSLKFHFSDATSKSREQSLSKKETLKDEDSSKMTGNNILQLISRLRGAEIVHEKVSIAEQSNQTTINIDVEELKEIGEEIEFLTKGVTELAIVLEDINKTTKEVKSWVQNKTTKEVKSWVQNKTEEISEEKLRFTGVGKD